MPKHVPGSWQALDEAIGFGKAGLADELGCSEDSLERMCSPPPDFTRTGSKNRGLRNWLDDLYTIGKKCPNGLHAIRWLVEALGQRMVPASGTPHDGQLLASPAVVMAAMEKLLRELSRRPARRKLSDDQVKDLLDGITDSLHALVADYLERGASS